MKCLPRIRKDLATSPRENGDFFVVTSMLADLPAVGGE